jgi:NAD(P)-dependent dehydrogenase (short-subunit alcohol dehydrogenase family)
MALTKGSNAIVTGGGTGIGQGIAIMLAEEKVNVVLCGRREGPLHATAERIQAMGVTSRSIRADVSDPEDVQKVVDQTMDEFGTVDILVNNAGVGGGGQIHNHEIETWDRVMAINLRGPFLMSRAVLPIMRKQGSGEIVNISSESALEYYVGNGAYGVSKHAVNALSEYIQRENQELGIRVHTICPGMVITEMTEGSAGLDLSKCLTPEDIADLVRWNLTRRDNIKIGRPILIQTMLNPWGG